MRFRPRRVLFRAFSWMIKPDAIVVDKATVQWWEEGKLSSSYHRIGFDWWLYDFATNKWSKLSATEQEELDVVIKNAYSKAKG